MFWGMHISWPRQRKGSVAAGKKSPSLMTSLRRRYGASGSSTPIAAKGA